MSVEVDLGTNGMIVLKDKEEAFAWIKKEKENWAWLKRRVGGTDINHTVQLFKQGWNIIESLIDSWDENLIKQKIQELYKDEGQIILSDSKPGRFICRIAEKNVDVASASIIYFLGQKILSNYLQEPAFQAASVAWASYSESISGIEDNLFKISSKGEQIISELEVQHQSSEDKLNEFNSTSRHLIDSNKSEFNSLTKNLTDELNAFKSKSQKDYEALKKFYTTELALKAPVTYWSTVASHHRILTNIWGFLFAMLLVGLSFLIIIFAEDIRVFLLSIERESVSIALTLAMGTIVFWALRMVAKIFLSNYQRAVDASERETMVKTFLALRREGNITDDKLDLVLGPLFRPGITGLVKDDSAPEYGVAALLSKFNIK